MSKRPPAHRPGPSLRPIELLLVGVMLGILGPAGLPSFGSPTALSKEAALVFDLCAVRSAIERHKVEQLARAQDWVVAALAADAHCPSCFPHGLPRNPVSALDSVREVVDMPAAPDGSTGWIYASRTGEFRANVRGTAPSGKPWFDL
jgi:type II secretory pathway pseudopilin PulG